MVVPGGLMILKPGLGALFLRGIICVIAKQDHCKVETGIHRGVIRLATGVY